MLKKPKDNKVVVENVSDLLICMVQFKEHKAWKMLAANTKMEKIEAILKTHELQIGKIKLYTFDGKTGEVVSKLAL